MTPAEEVNGRGLPARGNDVACAYPVAMRSPAGLSFERSRVLSRAGLIRGVVVKCVCRGPVATRHRRPDTRSYNDGGSEHALFHFHPKTWHGGCENGTVELEIWNGREETKAGG